MEQKELLLDNLFQEFLSSYNQAAPEEKQRVAAQFFPWAEQQMAALGIASPNSPGEGGPTRPDITQLHYRQDTIFQDIQSLIENENHLAQIAHNIEQVIWLSDVRCGQILYVSPAFETVWGRSTQSLYADPSILIDSVHPEDRVQVMVARPLNDHKPFNQVYRILRPDDNMRWIYARTFFIRKVTGEVDAVFCIAQDITNQKQIDLALRRTLDRIREQFDLSHKMSLARKPETVLKTLMSAHELRSAQRAAVLFFENPRAGPVRGMEQRATWLSSLNIPHWLSESSLYEDPTFWELFQSNRTVILSGIPTDPRLAPSVRDFLVEGKIQTLVIFPLVASGEWLGCLLVYYQQEHNFDHIDLRHLKVLVDQAAITLYNLQLLTVEEESRHEAERANEIKTQFLAMISHELRTPLTSIIGFTTTLLAEDVTWEADEQRDFIQTIQREANRLHELIDHLLVLSRLEAGMLPIALESHSVQEIVGDALPQLNTLTSGQTLTMHIPTNLPPFYCDAKRIAQVLVNLVRNASIYAPQGTEIHISASVRGSFMQINVIDQGPGIPMTEHKRVFKAFQRGLNMENSAVQGAGLGLAICKGLIEAHGGRIWIKKKNTPGATISFTIPLMPSAEILAGPAEKEIK